MAIGHVLWRYDMSYVLWHLLNAESHTEQSKYSVKADAVGCDNKARVTIVKTDINTRSRAVFDANAAQLEQLRTRFCFGPEY